jgi:GT2 family glycosyltransferase
MVMGLVQCLVLSETIEGSRTFNEFCPASLMTALGAGLYKRAVFEKLGNFDPKLQSGEDVDWFMRVRENGIPMSIIDSVTLYYRFHTTNTTRDRDIRNSFFLKAIKKSLDRRRLRGEGKAHNLPPLLLNPKN